MLLAVEGGGFFSSSASGYSKGLTLLLLGQKNEEKPMRVTPWNQYQLVDQESDPDLLLASGKNRLVRGCASFVCFGRAAAGLESPSPLKVGPTQQQDILPEPPVSDKGKDDTHTADLVDNDTIAKKVDLKSSLKKTTISIPVSSAVANESEALSKKGSDVPCHTERRKVQWTDVSGGELVEVREFEASPSSSPETMAWAGNLDWQGCSQLRSSFSSHFSDVKTSLEQDQSHLQPSPLKPFSFCSNPLPSKKPSKIASYEVISKNLSEYRLRFPVPPPRGVDSSSSSFPPPPQSSQHISFQELYKRNLILKNEESNITREKFAFQTRF